MIFYMSNEHEVEQMADKNIDTFKSRSLSLT